MQKRLNHFMLLFVVIAVIVTSAVNTTMVYADDGGTEPVPTESAPPAEEETAAPPSSEEETPPAEEPSSVPQATEPAVADEIAETTATEPAAEEPAPVAEVLEQLPEGTELVVISESGEIEPLASVEAAEIVATGDPMWCPEGATPGDASCTGSFATFEALLDALALDAASLTPVYGGENGIIWVESSYAGNDDVQIDFDGSVLTTLNSHNLTIRGGWSGGNNTTVNPATPSQLDVSLAVNFWAGNITIENLDFTGGGLDIRTTGNVVLDNVSVTSSSDDGAALVSTGDVVVTNSEFNGNSLTGLVIDTYGSATLDTVEANDNGYGLDIIADQGISLTGVTASSNNQFGAILDTSYSTGAISVTNSNFGDSTDSTTGNGLTGLHAVSGGTINLDNVSASYNGTNGAYLVAEGDIDVTNSTFNGNVQFNSPADPGLYAASFNGNILLWGVTANDNQYGAGVVLNTWGNGTIGVNGSQFNQNGSFGIQAGSDDGNITLDGVTASFNGIKGAYLGAFWAGNIFIDNSTFVENGSYGIYAFANEGNINLGNIGSVTVTGNNVTDYGALLIAGGAVSVRDSSFNSNTDVGLEVISGGQVTLTNVTADANGGNGVAVYSITTAGPICEGDAPVNIVVNVDGGTFTNNGVYGLMIKPGPEGTLDFVNPPTFSGNSLGNYLLDLSQQFKDCTCPPKPEEPPVTKGPKIVNVPSTGGPAVVQECDIYTGTILKLPNGTWVEIGCPFEGFSKLEEITQENLPGLLGDGITLESAIALGLVDAEGNVILNEDGTVTINFAVPEGTRARRQSILFWDTALNDGQGGWVQLPPYEIGTSFPLDPKNPDDPRTILSGVKQVGNTVSVTVNFSGVFALVSR